MNGDFVDNKRLFYRHKIGLIIEEVNRSPSSNDRLAAHLSCESSECMVHLDKLSNDDEIDTLADELKIDFNQYLLDNSPYLRLSQLKEMKKMGFTVGNHSRSHKNFRDLDFVSQKVELSAVDSFLKEELNVKRVVFLFSVWR